MKQPRDDGEGVSLDSLMDTLTGVIGVLVLVIVVCQLGLQEAVGRISQTTAADPEAMAALLKQLDALLLDKKNVTNQLDELRPGENPNAKTLWELNTILKNKEDRLNFLQRENEVLKKQNQEHEEKRVDFEKYELEHQKIIGELNANLEQQAKLKAILETTPTRAVLPPKIVNIPDPRSAPDGVTAIPVFCVHNKVYPLSNLEVIRKVSRTAVENLLKQDVRKYIKDPQKGIITDLFLEDCNRKLKYKSEDLKLFSVKLVDRNNTPYLVLETRPEEGISVNVVEDRNSSFFKSMTQIDPRKYYLMFYVATDSFDAYLSMRQAVSQLGLLAGWEPQKEDWVYETPLGGPLKFGPPPPPPDPNAPRPAPRPAGPPPPKPKVLD